MEGCSVVFSQLIGLLVGALASLLATGFLFLKNWRGEQIQSLLKMRSEIWEIATHIDYPYDYLIVVHSFERLHELVLRVYQLDSSFMWLLHANERKLVHAFLAELDSVCNLARDCNIGESDKMSEYESRLSRIKREMGYDAERNTFYAEYEIDLMTKIMDGWKIRSLSDAIRRMPRFTRCRVASLLLSGKIPGPDTNIVLQFKKFKAGEKNNWLTSVLKREIIDEHPQNQ